MANLPTTRTFGLGHLTLIALMVIASAAYLIDARATSLKTSNLALVQPAAIMIFVLAAVILAQAFRIRGETPAPSSPERRIALRREIVRVGLLALAFGVFVFSLEILGFDAATFLFVACGLYLCGEKRLWVIGLYALLFTLIVVWGYQQLVPYPFPMLVL